MMKTKIKFLGFCSKTVYPNDPWGSFHGHPCKFPSTVIRDGKPYCKKHDPVEVEKRFQARQDKCNEENRKIREKFRRDQAMKMACDGVATEVLENLSVKKLLERLNRIE